MTDKTTLFSSTQFFKNVQNVCYLYMVMFKMITHTACF